MYARVSTERKERDSVRVRERERESVCIIMFGMAQPAGGSIALILKYKNPASRLTGIYSGPGTVRLIWEFLVKATIIKSLHSNLHVI